MNQWKSIVLNLSHENKIDFFTNNELFWAGRSFSSRWLNKYVNAQCNPLGEENDIVFSVGLIAGSGASSSNRLSIGAKSPLTQGIKESNTGGNVGHVFSLLGIRALIVRGISDDWHYIYISKDETKVLSANSILGKNIYETSAILQGKYGNKAAVISIGPAGEMLLPAACIGITDTDGIPARHAARGGLAAVMGAKKIKAIVLDPQGSSYPLPYDKELLNAARKRFARALLAHPATGSFLPKYGTAGLLDVINQIGGLPTRNYSTGQFEHSEKIDGNALHELIINRNGRTSHACMPGCVIRCSNIIPSASGGELNRALEYETITLLGSNCGIGDLDAICMLNRRCDEIGVDTIEIGCAIAVAMEAGLADFGDSVAALRFLDEIEKGSDFGRLLGSGTKAVGEYFGVKRIPVVMGQSLAAYDPRVLKGTGVTYATSPMGADHTAGNVLPNTKLPNGEMPSLDEKEGQLELSKYLQKVAMIFDTLGLCWFSRNPILEDYSLVNDLIEAQHGVIVSFDTLLHEANISLQEENDFNNRAGLIVTNDLPEFFRNEPLPPTNKIFDIDAEVLKNLKYMD